MDKIQKSIYYILMFVTSTVGPTARNLAVGVTTISPKLPWLPKFLQRNAQYNALTPSFHIISK
jgi:hypothetical protein